MIPNLAFKFSYTMVHLFHRKKGGIWFLLDSIQHGEPDLDLKMKKLKRNATQLGEANLTTILVMPANEIKCFNIEIGQKPVKLTAKKLNYYLNQISTEPLEDSSYDWYLEDGRLNFALIQTRTLEKAVEFTTKYHFEPGLAVGLPQNKTYNKVVVFDINSKKHPGIKDLKQDTSQFDMVAVKLPKTASRDTQVIY